MYANVKKIYSSTALLPLGRSDHNLVHLLQTVQRQPAIIRTRDQFLFQETGKHSNRPECPSMKGVWIHTLILLNQPPSIHHCDAPFGPSLYDVKFPTTHLFILSLIHALPQWLISSVTLFLNYAVISMWAGLVWDWENIPVCVSWGGWIRQWGQPQGQTATTAHA